MIHRLTKLLETRPTNTPVPLYATEQTEPSIFDLLCEKSERLAAGYRLRKIARGIQTTDLVRITEQGLNVHLPDENDGPGFCLEVPATLNMATQAYIGGSIQRHTDGSFSVSATSGYEGGSSRAEYHHPPLPHEKVGVPTAVTTLLTATLGKLAAANK